MLPAFFPFLLSIALGGLLGSTAIDAVVFVCMAIVSSEVFHNNGFYVPLILTEIIGGAISIVGILAAIRWRRAVGASAVAGIGLGLLAGASCAHLIIHWLDIPGSGG
jgi:hypothetical protein